MDNGESNYLGRYISQVHRKGSAFITKKVSKYNIGYGQCIFLIQLYIKEGRSQEQLAEILDIDKGAAARAIKKLMDQELVYRIRDDKDKRAYNVYLTDKAKEIKQDILDILKEWEDILTKELTLDEKDQIINLLKKISKNKKCR